MFLDGVCNFKWDRNAMGSSIELSNNDMNVFLKESAYMFRTIIGDFVRYYENFRFLMKFLIFYEIFRFFMKFSIFYIFD